MPSTLRRPVRTGSAALGLAVSLFVVGVAPSVAATKSKPAVSSKATKAKTAKTVNTKAQPATSVATTAAPASAPSSTSKPTGPNGNVVTVDGISADRCAANKRAGKITYLSGFDYAAAASIVEMIVADAKGYFAAMCLDVDVKASFSTANYGLVADNKAQFASSGSYTELLRNTPKEKSLVMVYNLGKTTIDTLMVRDNGKIERITELRGKVIGMKGDIPSSILAMLNKAGLKRGVDYRDQLVDGFNPVAHFALPIDALPGWKSNEPGQLERNNPPVKIRTFDPTEYNIPGSFGIVYSNAEFLKQHPTAAQDFVRAALKGYSDAAADPDEAVAFAVKRINATGNRNFLSPVGESFRWKQEARIIAENTPAKQPVGLVVPRLLQQQVDEYTEAGVFSTKPAIGGTFDESIARGVYGPDNRVVWPKAS